MSEQTDLELLEKFLIDNPDLDKLENMLGHFNVFETLNIVNAELRHSSVLAWLLNPDSNHGLGEYFLKQFLINLVRNNRSELQGELSIFDFELFNYADTEVRREWNNIDILIILNEDQHKIVIPIENKIKSSEYSGQLERYRKIIENEFKDYKRLYVYLTPENVIPSDDKWLLYNYDVVAGLVGNLLDNKGDLLNENVEEFIKQYKTVLRRYVVGNSEIEEICKRIYKRHEKALDLIFQYKPDMQLEISEYLQEFINEENSMIFDSGSKTYVRFTSHAIDSKVKKISEGWISSGRILLFEFSNQDKRLVLKLFIGPGDQEYRTKLYDFCNTKSELFALSDTTLYSKWKTVYQKEILSSQDYKDKSIEDLKPVMKSRITNFLQNDYKKINDYFDHNWELQ